ncbi:hypothetical protein [Streptomyces agglomeratus]|uniref:hypothetical protein n=1 Tax=Streptomyces agglomeratus TaxID=285458 RepID=UPI000854E637|nr:hypothetical protein [Streptomyces agglomeratus]OEJ53714.1 hypothetical protein BGK72_25910 [Streptomyces agglomeratus]
MTARKTTTARKRPAKKCTDCKGTGEITKPSASAPPASTATRRSAVRIVPGLLGTGHATN